MYISCDTRFEWPGEGPLFESDSNKRQEANTGPLFESPQAMIEVRPAALVQIW